MIGRKSIVQMSLIIFVIYLALTDNIEPSNLVIGLLIGAMISLLIRPKNLSITWRRLPEALWAFLRYLGILMLDLAQSGYQVGRILLSPNLPINPGISTIDTDCQTELSSALSAHSITLTPGELVVEMDDQGMLYVHCLNVEKTAQYAAMAQQMRRDLLSKIFQ